MKVESIGKSGKTKQVELYRVGATLLIEEGEALAPTKMTRLVLTPAQWKLLAESAAAAADLTERPR
jgi:hypothetical protein